MPLVLMLKKLGMKYIMQTWQKKLASNLNARIHSDYQTLSSQKDGQRQVMTETMETSLTLFKSIFDNKTHKRMNFRSFAEFEKLLFELSKVKRKDKKAAQLISPATYIENTTRANNNVIDWGGWCAVDVDDHEFKGDLKSELDVLAGDYHYVCYSTASSRIDSPKFRL